MFDRKKYKYFARQQLQNRWNIPAFITIITGLVMLIFSIPEVIETFRTLPELVNVDFLTQDHYRFLFRLILEKEVQNCFHTFSLQ